MSFQNRPRAGFFVSMDIPTLIRQQQSTVKMLEKLVGAKRASAEELAKARRRLADLEDQLTFKPLPQLAQVVATPAPVDPTGLALGDDEYTRLQGELSRDLDKLTKKQAQMSNELQLVPRHLPCADKVRAILALKAEIEALWDKKRYLERNHRLPPDVTPETKPDALPTLPGNDEARYELAYQKRRLQDQRSKLKRKLDDPKARPSKRQEWEQELAQCELKIHEVEYRLSY
jgi:hypothetical protein